MFTTTTTQARRRMDRPGFKAATQVAASSAAVPGTSIHCSSARPSATGTPQTTGASILVSVWRGRLPLNSLLLYFFTSLLLYFLGPGGEAPWQIAPRVGRVRHASPHCPLASYNCRNVSAFIA
jgi:hypothetical protein